MPQAPKRGSCEFAQLAPVGEVTAALAGEARDEFYPAEELHQEIFGSAAFIAVTAALLAGAQTELRCRRVQFERWCEVLESASAEVENGKPRSWLHPLLDELGETYEALIRAAMREHTIARKLDGMESLPEGYRPVTQADADRWRERLEALRTCIPCVPLPERPRATGRERTRTRRGDPSELPGTSSPLYPPAHWPGINNNPIIGKRRRRR